MKRMAVVLSLLAIFAAIALGKLPAIARSAPPSDAEIVAPLFDNLGDYHHPVTTDDPRAQRYFDQGLILAYGFNHPEAARSFREAARLDRACAMCHWGLAYVLGPNINASMDEGDVSEAWEALQTAIALSETAPDREKAYIRALAKRYGPDPEGDRAALDRAYADAMREVARRYPDDPDAATLFAESLMDTMPWDYWEPDGTPKPETAEVLDTLEAVLAKNPDHPGANHFYIHAVEKERPELGVASADRLRDRVPGAGHLLHMPSHIYIRVGRYDDAVLANQKAIAADLDYADRCHALGIYTAAYMPHNHHFLWYAATMAGRRDVATAAARSTAEGVMPTEANRTGYGTLQHFSVIPLYNFVKFGMWDEILAAPAPPAGLKYPAGVWHYARGMAFVNKNRSEAAAEELRQLRAIASDPELPLVQLWEINNTADDLLAIASEVLAGELAAGEEKWDDAIAHLERAIAIEDGLNYDEPASWHSPVRQSLGGVLLKAGRYSDAERVYREDLEIYPDNIWSLRGLDAIEKSEL